jgi:hypothetical protein
MQAVDEVGRHQENETGVGSMVLNTIDRMREKSFTVRHIFAKAEPASRLLTSLQR